MELKIINEHLSIGLLNLNEYSARQGISGKREIEKSGTKHILERMCGETGELEYDVNNKPHLKNRIEHISISHSHDYLALALNKTEETGIDIELIRDKVRDVRHKFLNETEKKLAGSDTEKLITYWAAKEALYKAHGKKGVDFSKHILVNETNREIFEGRIEKENIKKRYLLRKEKIGNYILVYTLEHI